MFRLVLIVAALAILIAAGVQFRRQFRRKAIEDMSADDLVDAIIRREISILEVPPEQKEEVDRQLEEIRKE
ncbi:MAG: hypothetical protein CSB33_01885 [Desulfobacterales bacterium]|nr:MAG: hypothetical protein CSB33_01885 [Desulfobacterales bacterium]